MADPLTLFHVSDVHFGVEDQLAHRWFANAVAAERPDAVICTGDITQRATRRQRVVQQRRCRYLVQHLGQVGIHPRAHACRQNDQRNRHACLFLFCCARFTGEWPGRKGRPLHGRLQDALCGVRP